MPLGFSGSSVPSSLPSFRRIRWARSIGLSESLRRWTNEGRAAEDAGRHQLPGRRQRVRRGLPRPPQEREAARPGPCAPRSVARLLGSSDCSGLEAPSQAARRELRRAGTLGSCGPASRSHEPMGSVQDRGALIAPEHLPWFPEGRGGLLVLALASSSADTRECRGV